jgi:hypothetical protein
VASFLVKRRREKLNGNWCSNSWNR